MPVYYKEKPEYLRSSIESMLAQTVPADDFVIVCDGVLTPDLERVLSDFSAQYPDVFRLVRLPDNRGTAAALNAGLQYCKNEIVARMDSDDISLPERCEQELKLIESADVVGSAVSEFEVTPDNLFIRAVPESHEEIVKFARRRNPICHPSVMFRKSKVLEAGGYEDSYLTEDYLLWAKVLTSGAIFRNAAKPLLYMRTGEGFYKRRGGIKYFRSLIRLRKRLTKIGLSGYSDFLVCAAAHTVQCFSPPIVRRYLYRRYLRKSV